MLLPNMILLLGAPVGGWAQTAEEPRLGFVMQVQLGLEATTRSPTYLVGIRYAEGVKLGRDKLGWWMGGVRLEGGWAHVPQNREAQLRKPLLDDGGSFEVVTGVGGQWRMISDDTLRVGLFVSAGPRYAYYAAGPRELASLQVRTRVQGCIGYSRFRLNLGWSYLLAAFSDRDQRNWEAFWLRAAQVPSISAQVGYQMFPFREGANWALGPELGWRGYLGNWADVQGAWVGVRLWWMPQRGPNTPPEEYQDYY